VATLASDLFTRADNATLGPLWTTRQSGPEAFAIVSNQAAPTFFNDCCEFYNAITWPNDHYSQAVLSGLSGTTNLTGLGVACRVRTDNIGGGVGFNDMYECVVNTAASNNVTVNKWVAGSYTMLTQRTQAWTNGDVLRMSVQGSTIRIYRNSVQMGADFVDPSPLTGYPCAPGLAGIGLYDGGVADTWEGGTVTQVLLADADLAAGGWTTSPLFSKVNDGSDATIITAAAS